MKIQLTVNKEKYSIEIEPHTYLLDALRKIGFHSVRKGCDTASCGVCTVLVDDNPVLSCSYPAARAQDHEITTVEGLGEEADKIVESIISEGADQCGYCGPALVLTTYALKREIPNPTLEEIKQYLVGNYCRCSGYEGQLRGIKKYLGVE